MEVVTPLRDRPSPANSQALALAQAVFENQARALDALGESLDNAFLEAVDLILSCTGKVIVCGMGKSGIIGRKIAATLASTGTPSFFVHPGEAYHGDLGMIGGIDLVLLISHSGETDEVIKLIPYLRHIQAKTIAITGRADSTLARSANVHLNVSIERETCPNNLAPTTSTTVTLVMGDALAVALMNRREFMPLDFARFHPGGSLGKKLLTLAKDVMHDVPCLPTGAAFDQIVNKISQGEQGIVCIVSSIGELLGVVTDGDLRRALEKSAACASLSAQDMMGTMPVTIGGDRNLHDCEILMRERKLTSLIVAEAGVPLGVIKSFDA